MIQSKLPDYKKIASEVRKNKVFAEEGEVEAELQWLQKSKAKFSQKAGLCQTGDFVQIEFSSPQIESGKVFKDGFILGKGHFLPGFEPNIEGMKAGQEKEFSFVSPFGGRLKPGQKMNFKVKMISVQKIELPEINDQLAKNLGKFESLEALKKSIKEGIQAEKERMESQRTKAEILTKISEKSEIEVPDELVQKEKERMLEELKRFVSEKLKTDFKEYLKRVKKTEKELSDVFQVQAQKRVKNLLVLREISKKENIEVADKEVKEEVDKILKRFPKIEKDNKDIDLEKLKVYTKEALTNEKTLQMLEGFSLKP